MLAYFAVFGVANGVWLARIPTVKADLHLSDGVLGLALLGGPAGLVVVVPFASRIVHRAGSRLPTWIAGICAAFVPVALGLAPNVAALVLALFAFGLVCGMLDVGMNSQAVIVERAAGRPLMTSFHACYSFGALAGALLGSAFAWAGVAPAVNFAVVAVPLACGAVLAGWWLVPDHAGNEVGQASSGHAAEQARASQAGQDGGPAATTRPGDLTGWRRLWRRTSVARTWITLPLLLMASLAVCALICEGAAEGWSAVYLRDNLGTSAGLAALAYAGFSVAMAFGRLTGDRLAARFGSVTLMRCCGLVAAAGLGLGLLSGNVAGAIAGFVVFGAGLSCTFPLVISAAGNAVPARPSYGIARVAGFGYLGMLGGPVLIGGLASALGLQRALVVPVVLALAIAAGAGIVSPRNTR